MNYSHCSVGPSSDNGSHGNKCVYNMRCAHTRINTHAHGYCAHFYTNSSQEIHNKQVYCIYCIIFKCVSLALAMLAQLLIRSSSPGRARSENAHNNTHRNAAAWKIISQNKENRHTCGKFPQPINYIVVRHCGKQPPRQHNEITTDGEGKNVHTHKNSHP